MPKTSPSTRCGLSLLALAFGLWAPAPAGAATIWLVTPDASPAADRFAAELRPALAADGDLVRETTAADWISQGCGSGGPGDLTIILPNAAWPAKGRTVLEEYLRRGNHLLNLSATAFSALEQPLVLETLSPAYKTYPSAARRLQLPGKTLDQRAETPITIPIPRQRGLGCDAVRPTRFIPVAEALDENGRSRGAAAHLYLNTATSYAGAVWGAVGLPAAALGGGQADLIPLVAGMAARIQRGVFLANAGPEHFAYAEGEKTTSGADLVNLGDEARTVRVSISITRKGRAVHQWSEDVALPARTVSRPVQTRCPSLELLPGEYEVAVRVHEAKALLDEVACPVQVIAFGAVPAGDVVKVGDGDFLLHGRSWHPLGMNYWPHLSAALEPREFSRGWLSPEQYDPAVVERDLAQAAELGVNVLSIQYAQPEQARPLMDFMARAAHHGLKVIIYSPAFEPLRPDPEKARRLILAAHLRESPAMFAYDVCWEGHLGDKRDREPFNARWEAWVAERYGSVAEAEADWRYSPPRADGLLAGPTDEQLTNDGDWRVYVAAYRRFWDDEISRCYREVRTNLLAADPVHLVSARSGYGGNGTPMYAHLMPFDLSSGAKHLDFISPEGYALRGDWNEFMRGGLTTAYSRLVGGGKPVFWAEYGVPLLWQVEARDYRPPVLASDLEPQRAYFETTLRFARESGANGCSGWWWPGGYRVDEKSDFGIINPDGTPRPAALELRKAAASFAEDWSRRAPDVYLEIDRDRQVSGYAGLYTTLADQYVRAFLDGHAPAVRTAGTGTTSADTPPLAVGNVPWTGRNPPKFLNGEFTRVELRAGDDWRPIHNGDEVEAGAGKLRLRVAVANTAEARWLPPADGVKTGGVSLVVEGDSGRLARRPLPSEVPYLGDGAFPEFEIDVPPGSPATVALRLLAEGRTAFGEVFMIRLRPRGAR